MNNRVRLPKVNVPQLHNVLARERLFALFDRVQDVSVVWIAAAPGAGKSTAVASYLERSTQHVAWLQVDADDSDPATFFSNLALAIRRALPKQQLRFPVFEPDYSRHPEVFAQVFFRYMAGRLAHPLRVVIDNAQEIPQNDLANWILVAVKELPAYIRLVIISRHQAPTLLVGLEATQQLAAIETSQLRFNLAEAGALLGFEPPAVESVHRHTDGWAAGLVLARESLGTMAKSSVIPMDIAQEKIFDYFMVEVFERMDAKLQEFLFSTAYLPIVPVEAAVTLSANPDAEELLNYLCQRNLFTYRKSSKPSIYEYHALFREFLQTRAATTTTIAQRHSACKRSATLLNLHGFADLAISLYQQSEAWEESIKLLLENARMLCSQSRQQILVQWIRCVPTNLRATHPWLLFWLGEAHLAIDEMKARQFLEEAYEHFCKDGDKYGQLLTAATALEAIHIGYTTYPNTQKWAYIVVKLFDNTHYDIETADVLRIAAGRLIASVLFDRSSGDEEHAANRVEKLLFENIDINRRIAAATILLEYYSWGYEREKMMFLVAQVTSLMRMPGLSELKRARWLSTLGYHLLIHQGTRQSNLKEAEKYLQAAEKIAVEMKLTSVFTANTIYQVNLALKRMEIDRAEELLSRLEASLDTSYGEHVADYYVFSAYVALAKNDGHRAVACARMAVEHCSRIHFPESLQPGYLRALVLALLFQGEYAEALNTLEIEERLSHHKAVAIMSARELVRAYVAIKTEQPEKAVALLRTALPMLRKNNYKHFYSYTPGIAAALCQVALSAGIEEEFVCQVAAERGLLSPKPQWNVWPWPVKIYALRPFAMEINGKPLNVWGKSPVRLIELVQAVLAYGGRDVASGDLIQLLWPGENRVGGENVFDNTLYRLRKLFADDSTLLVKNNRVSLNPELVWIDAWSVEATLDQLITDVTGDLNSFNKAADNIFALYQNHLLHDATQKIRLLLPGKNLWVKVRHFLLKLGELRETAGNSEAAIAAYRFALKHDPLADEFYRAMMQLHLRLQQPCEALNVYSACRHSYRTLLNQEPSQELRKLARAVG